MKKSLQFCDKCGLEYQDGSGYVFTLNIQKEQACLYSKSVEYCLFCGTELEAICQSVVPIDAKQALHNLTLRQVKDVT